MFPLLRFHEAQGPIVQCRHGGFQVRPTQDAIVIHWQRNDEAEPHIETFARDDAEYDPAFRAEIGDWVRWISTSSSACDEGGEIAGSTVPGGADEVRAWRCTVSHLFHTHTISRSQN
jgi:hypothetical protein